MDIKVGDKVKVFRAKSEEFEHGFELIYILKPTISNFDYPSEKCIVAKNGDEWEVYIADVYRE